MTTYYETTSTVGTLNSVPTFTLLQYDELVVAPNVDIGATNSDCVSTAATGVTIVNSGEIFGEGDAIASTGTTPGAQIAITNEQGAEILGSDGAIYIGLDPFFITNRGTIATPAVSSFAMETFSSGTFWNF